MPMNKALYPKNWGEISKARRESAGNRCEWCGIPNHAVVIRNPAKTSEFLYLGDTPETDYWFTQENVPVGGLWDYPDWYNGDQKQIKIVLTVAHLDQNPANNEPANLVALCQRCHLNHDRPHNLPKVRRTKIRRKHERLLKNGQKELWT